MTSERRRLRRHFKRVAARFQSGPVSGQGYLRNVSKAGMFLRCDRLPKPRSEVLVTLESASGQKLEVRGRVIWTTAELPNAKEVPPGFGVSVEGNEAGFRAFYESMLLG